MYARALLRIFSLTFRAFCLFDHSVCTCGHPMDALETHLLRFSYGGERTAAHDAVRDAINYNIRDADRAVVLEKTEFLPSSN